ncbi:hypothetical protein CHGG_05482 [Chaetomium globosum CBS 148.51]|uniref:ATPase AAA-type core domain-containing protein n=1 Tax=Chaetomium globosum (strain ATCC 6205 / CBS 148.51 / DSM 1962 / NBRC 6347 / NRRL 1970) TaxID=306901 RepID=Q2H783_CHAGB|nr:uncharacterized protein CHGG_05482 [Chaetomium globosum CBS 148.51]EAQ88863.1 hypothetical protein CHGG_05482 [Chaetomium globosum CBS 148.51]
MNENAPATDSATRRPVHPFFAQNRSTTPVAEKPAVNDAPNLHDNSLVFPSNTTVGGETGKDVTDDIAARSGRRRKADDELNVEYMPRKARPIKRTRNSAGAGDIEKHFIKLDSGAGGENRSGPGSSGADVSAESTKLSAHAAMEGCHGIGNGFEAWPSPNEQPIAAKDSGVFEPAAPQAATANSAKPKKMLQFNPKTGTIGSPPKPKEVRVPAPEAEIGKKVASRRGRKRASKIVRITYGADQKARARLGEMINAILDGKAQDPRASAQPPPTSNNEKQLPKTTETLAPKSANATTHPFFLGQSKISDPAAADSKPKKRSSSPASARTKHYCATPCSPRKPRVGPASKVPLPQFGVKSLGLKFPGAKLPAWPWQGMVHVRGDENEIPGVGTDTLPLAFRKSKGNAVKMLPSESVINLVADSMQLSSMAKAVKNIDTDNFIPPPPELRLPQKHFESGSKLQSRILPELRTFQPSLQTTQDTYGSMHAPPQLARLFASISSSLSAFDMSQYEMSNWVQKYAPITATEVLQPGREIFFLRDWLQVLMVQAVDTGSAVDIDKAKAGSKSKSAGTGKKKRRKKLDGFIVSSEDESYEWYDESEDEADWAPSGSRGILRKTVIRSGNRARGRGGDKTANALVISGPRGCGKTAAVYAVAKELDFEVFEINASSRRNGKDVLEKIGDMTRNHHVQQHQSSEGPDNQEVAIEDDTAKNIKSGKQPTMNAFFAAKPKESKSKQSAKIPAKTKQSEAKKEPAKVQPKRPFIMTCNDETLVPLHTLTLHGIFRLSPPPDELAVDRLLLIAANEGHSLARRSVEQLYNSRGRDLRATTMDLQYWCQIGVGDRRGGLDWFYPRWPRGVDLDENKEVVRVISQDTYRAGMNLLGRDPIIDPMLSPRLVEEEVLHQAWDSWGFDLGNWQDTPEMTRWAEGSEPVIQTPSDRLGALCAYDDLAEAMSAADVCSSRSFAAFKEESMDTTQPDLPAKARDDFVLGITHLETPVIMHYNSLSTCIASTIKSLARSLLEPQTERLGKQAVPTLRPLEETHAARRLQDSFTSPLPSTPAINRIDFAFAFDPIAAPDTTPVQLASYLEPSVFDRTLKLITLDVAPYVRSIVAYESRLQKQRVKMSSLVSEGGKGGQGSKRMRTTRAALSALEGGSRSSTRGERWFSADINPYLVAKTAGASWNGFEVKDLDRPEEPKDTVDSPKTSPDTTPTKAPKRAVLKSRKRKKVLQDEDDVDELGC